MGVIMKKILFTMLLLSSVSQPIIASSMNSESKLYSAVTWLVLAVGCNLAKEVVENNPNKIVIASIIGGYVTSGAPAAIAGGITAIGSVFVGPSLLYVGTVGCLGVAAWKLSPESFKESIKRKLPVKI